MSVPGPKDDVLYFFEGGATKQFSASKSHAYRMNSRCYAMFVAFSFLQSVSGEVSVTVKVSPVSCPWPSACRVAKPDAKSAKSSKSALSTEQLLSRVLRSSTWTNIAPGGTGNGCCRVDGNMPQAFSIIETESKAKCKQACVDDNCGVCYAVETKKLVDGRWKCELYGRPVPNTVSQDATCISGHQCLVYSNEG